MKIANPLPMKNFINSINLDLNKITKQNEKLHHIVFINHSFVYRIISSFNSIGLSIVPYQLQETLNDNIKPK